MGAGDPVDAALDLRRGETWTAPHWASRDDVAFFHYASSAYGRARKLRKLLATSGRVTPELKNFLDYAEDRASTFGGHIFAYAILDGPAVYIQADDDRHWRTRRYAPIKRITQLPEPIRLKDYNGILPRPHSAITALTAAEFSDFKRRLMSLGLLPRDLQNVEAGRDTLVGINDKNWQMISCGPEQHFRHETELRSALCDHLLDAIADPASTVYREVKCVGPKCNGVPRADYVFQIAGQWIPVEVKLNIQAWPDLLAQVAQYTNAEVFRRVSRA